MRGYACIGLDNPKTPANIGHVLRAAGCFGASMVALAGPRPSKLKSIGKCPTDTMCAYRRIPTIWTSDLHDIIPHDCVPVAIEIFEGAQSLLNYRHPERAFYVFGAEDATLGVRILSWCRDVVSIPTEGCLNLAACVNVVLYDRLFKTKGGGRE